MKDNTLVRDLKSARKLGLALGGGGARGLAHIGVIKIMNEYNIKPDALSGSSFGAIVGAFYANGYTWQDMYEIIEKTKWHSVLDLSLKGGFLKGEAYGKMLSKHLPERFEDLKLPLAVVATKLETGRRVVINTGKLVPALRASSCYPGAFEPVILDGDYMIDGGIVDNVPISALEIFAVDRNIAVDVTVPTDRHVVEKEDPSWWTKLKKKLGLQTAGLSFDIMLKSIEIMQANQTSMTIAATYPDLYVHVQLPGIRMYHFDKYEEIIKAGENEMRDALLKEGRF